MPFGFYPKKIYDYLVKYASKSSTFLPNSVIEYNFFNYVIFSVKLANQNQYILKLFCCMHYFVLITILIDGKVYRIFEIRHNAICYSIKTHLFLHFGIYVQGSFMIILYHFKLMLIISFFEVTKMQKSKAITVIACITCWFYLIMYN